jgi:hypothetical protein
MFVEGRMTYVVPPSLPINLHINPHSRPQGLPYVPTIYFRLDVFGDEDMVYGRESCSLYVDDFQFDGFESIGMDDESAGVVRLSAAYEFGQARDSWGSVDRL